ncbi:hypothetical protein HX004_10220 [Myroides sp. 1354]|uniref:hypothetical protein n=1 Tax=unclassified Myroides TaxID=2642485 RepID=UPI00257700BB|nr:MULTISPECIES: hypothetical protein [unclassified Myroides]MDM1045263.1 hypothetical protein [Myroides sp. R163-1]MDM1056145.1 hypothetical protein [Myroides sp. 1354]MDM1069274.1 hypothetical protein [Myroides sp. 1372]
MQTIKNNQSLFDFALQTYGNVCAVFDIALTNNSCCTDLFEVGTMLELPKSEYTAKGVLEYYHREHIELATVDGENDEIPLEEFLLKGITPVL